MAWTRLIASNTRRSQRWRHFCTESPMSTPNPSPSAARQPDQPNFNPYARTAFECKQSAEFEKRRLIFLLRRPSETEYQRFLQREYDKLQKDDVKYPGKLTKITEGAYKGQRLYSPTLEAIPTKLPSHDFLSFTPEEEQKWQTLFMENREKWFKEGKFEIEVENALEIGWQLRNKCDTLTEGAVISACIAADESWTQGAG